MTSDPSPASREVNVPLLAAAAAPVPALSILIPAYNQPSGLERILASLQTLRLRTDVEIRVSDDSTDDQAAAKMASACDAFCGVHYRRNRPGRGAVPNWNILLDEARGHYCLLLHHDEEIAPGTDLPSMLSEIASGTSPDVWLLACRVIRRPGGEPRLHFPAQWAVALVRRWPAYLLRRNLLGSPSVLVVRRQAYPRFDGRFQWRVDVEAYVRLLVPGIELRVWPKGGLISHNDSANSITASLASRLVNIETQERRLLLQLHGAMVGAWAWLSPSLGPRCVRAFEASIWGFFRAVSRCRQLVIGSSSRARR